MSQPMQSPIMNKLGQKFSDDNLKDRLDTVKQLIDPVFVIEQLGFKITHETSKELRCACLVHGGDNPTAFRVNRDLKTWVCFTHKCHSKYGNDMIGLVRAIKGCAFMEALRYLEELTGSSNVNRESLLRYKQKREQQEFIRRSSLATDKPAVVDDLKLKYYIPYRSSFFYEEGFSKETLDYFQIAGGFQDMDGLLKDVIPIRDDKGRLVAYSLRDTRRNIDYDRKYRLTAGFTKDKALYNLHNCKDMIRDKPVIVVEGFKSVWRLHDIGVDNVVACMGSSLTQGQANLLCTYTSSVVLFLDPDEAGQLGVSSSYDLLRGKMKVFSEFIMEVDPVTKKGLDPADLTKEQLLYYIGSYR